MLYLFISDKFWFIILQIGIFSILFFSLFRDWRSHHSNPSFSVVRGKESRDYINKTGGIIITFFISFIFQISSYPKNQKVLIYVIDLLILYYLLFFSGWFTNQIITIKNNIESRKL